jgi:hypothetical protein
MGIRFTGRRTYDDGVVLRAKPSEPGALVVEPLGYLRLHLNELESLLVDWGSKCESTELVAGEEIADNAQDLSNVDNKQLANVAVKLKNPHVTVTLHKHWANIGYFHDDASVVLAHHDGNSLQPYKRRRPYFRQYGFWLMLVTAILAVKGFFAPSKDIMALDHWFLWLTGVEPFAFAWIWAVQCKGVNRGSGAKIIPASIGDRSWSFSRNRSQWLIGMTMGVICAVVGFVLGWIAKA